MTNSPFARLRPVPIDAVHLEDCFWAPRLKINQETSLPAQFQLLEESGTFDNFRRVTGEKDVPFKGYVFNDSDVYKWLEAAAWSLASRDDPGLRQKIAQAVDLVEAAQCEDGYLDTYFALENAGGRWTNLRDKHEMYCAGHLFQAAIALRRAGGEDGSSAAQKLFDVALRLADHIISVFGPGKKPGVPGHPEIEMALVELGRETGDRRYTNLAAHFIDQRGQGLIGGSEYHIDHQPLRELRRMTGHAVRMVYLNAGAADLYAEFGDDSLKTALERLWEKMMAAQIYINGGLGARYDGESLGGEYELPNERSYAETCAAIGNVMWNWRMLQLEGQARYADLMEWTLYNAVLPGISLDGLAYFYENPLANDGSHRRQPWFPCACCPPNIARLLAQLPGYGYSISDQGAWVHLYAEGSAHLVLPGGQEINLTQSTQYPWNGEVRVEIQSTSGRGESSLFFRIPGWCMPGSAKVVLNGATTTPDEQAAIPASYLEIRREWKPGDSVHLSFPMLPHWVESHPYLFENSGRIAMQRGPLLYCFEAADQPGIELRGAVVDPGLPISIKKSACLPGEMVALGISASLEVAELDWRGRLYREAGLKEQVTRGQAVELIAIPYFAWANRQAGQMSVWLRRRFSL